MPSRNGSLAPALLTDATWYGTLAAVRDLGLDSVPVTLACEALIAPARFSRFVARTVPMPRATDGDAFVAWLAAFGEREPRHMLYPTSDEVAWHLSAHRDELARHFFLYSPPLESLVAVLDKAQLAAHAAAAGLDVPTTWCVASEAEALDVARHAGFPLYVKPRAQVLARARGEGVRVGGRDALRAAWRAWQRRARYDPQVRAHMPGVEHPIIQVLYPDTERIYTVDGFIDECGEHSAMLACVKLLQRPRGTGPGLVFEDAEVDPRIEAGLRALCRRTGFFGVFDAEFLVHGDRRMLIDFNPRFYHHMAFEIDRGLRLPALAYHAAVGNTSTLRSLVNDARAARELGRAYVHRLPTRLLLALQGLSGAMTREERERWRTWIAARNDPVTDPALRHDDRLPALAELAMEMVSFARHPRTFVRRLTAQVH